MSLVTRFKAFLFLSVIGFAMSAQSLSLVQTANLSKCTGDSLRLELNIGAQNYPLSNSFKIFIAPGQPSSYVHSSATQMPIVKWRSISPLPVSTDTNSIGTKYAWVQIPTNITSSGFYSIVVRSTGPVQWSDTISILINLAPNASITAISSGFNNIYTAGPDWGYCQGDSVYLFATPGLNSYQWYLNGTPIIGATSDSVLVLTSGTYAVDVSNGVCSSFSPDTVVNEFIPSTLVTHNPGAMQTLQILDNDATIDSVGFCETEFITLEGPSPTVTGSTILYQWLQDSLDVFGTKYIVPINGATNLSYQTNTTGVYYLETVWVPGGCPDTSSAFWVFVDTIPDTEIQVIPWPGQPTASLVICESDSTQLSAIATSPTWNYQWEVRFPAGSGNWATVPGATNSTLNVSYSLVPGTAEYRMRITNSYCEHTTSELLVTILPLPSVVIPQGDSISLCAGDSVLLGAVGPSTSYSWSTPSGTIAGASFYAVVPGMYIVEGTNSAGCSNTDTIQVYYITVNANAGPDQTVLPGSTVQLSATGGLLYYWYADVPTYFSDPYNPNAQTFPTQDTTMYVVEVLNSNGCFDTDTMFVYTFDPATLVPNLSNVMNLITPNGDGFNDVFDLSELVRADSCDLVVLDRWGAQVFEQKRYISGWDGSSQGGDPLPDGTYYYLLVCDDIIRFRGAITVVRP